MAYAIATAVTALSVFVTAPPAVAAPQDAALQDAARTDASLLPPDAPESGTAPVMGGEPVLPDVTFIRGAVSGPGVSDSVRVALDMHMTGALPDTLFFPTVGLRVDSALVNGRRTTIQRLSNRTGVSVRPDSVRTPPHRESDGDAPDRAGVQGGPERRAGAPTESETRVTLFYVVRSGLNRRTANDGALAVWTAPGGIDADWLPLPSASDDLFHADLAFSLPAGWTLVRPPIDAEGDAADDSVAARSVDARADSDEPRIHLLRPPEAVTARDLGFVAVRTDALRGDIDRQTPDPHVLAVGAGILDRPADSVRAELGRISDFLGRTLALSVPGDAGTHLLIGGSPGGAVGSDVVIHGDAYPVSDEPWTTDFVQRESIIEAMLAPSLTRMPTTDVWLRSAVVAWLSAQHVRSVHGEAAFGDVLEDLRAAYLEEARGRSRPLVWDRWTSPVDLADGYARSRGAWILHMLEATVGREALLSGLDAFLDLPDDRLRDTEAFRESVEAYANVRLSPFFDAWVYGAGHPVLDITTSHDAAGERFSIRIAQVQDGELTPAVFPMAPGIRFASIAGVTTQDIRIDEQVTEATFDASIAPTYFHMDTRAGWLFEYESAPGDDDLVSMLRDDDAPASRVRIYKTLARGGAEPGLLFGARRVIEAETDPVAKAVGLTLPAAMAPAASAQRMLLEHASDVSPIVRARVFRGLSGFDAPAVGDAALRAANSDSSPLVLAAAVPVLITRRPSIAWDVVESALVTPSPGHRVRLTALRMIAGLDHPDEERLRALLDHTGEGQPFALRRTAALEAANAFPTNARVRRLAAQWLASEEALLRLTALDMIGRLPVAAADELLADPDPTSDPDPRVRARLHRLQTASETY